MTKIDGVCVHPSVTASRIINEIEDALYTLDNPGICIACGASATDCEPDARQYRCEECNRLTVYGAEELLFYIG